MAESLPPSSAHLISLSASCENAKGGWKPARQVDTSGVPDGARNTDGFSVSKILFGPFLNVRLINDPDAILEKNNVVNQKYDLCR